MQADHVLERAGDEEILLRQPQSLARLGLVVRIEHLGDGFRYDLLVHRAVVIADVERFEIEGFGGLRLPQAQQVRGRHPIAGHGSVVGDAFDDLLRNPAHPIAALFVIIALGAPAELHIEGDFRTDDLPGVAEAQPLVRQLDLPAVANRLIEDAELVADAVADRRNIERRQRVHVTSGQAAEPAVAQARLFFLLQKVGQILPDFGYCLLGRLPDTEVDQAVAQMRPGQKFS